VASPRVAGNAFTSARTATVQSVTASATEQTLLVANDDRLGGYIVNDADKVMYIKYGTGVTATSFTDSLDPKNSSGVGGKHNINDGLRSYTGVVTVIWAAAPTGAARVTELSYSLRPSRAQHYRGRGRPSRDDRHR
jgi:hypothetical protein